MKYIYFLAILFSLLLVLTGCQPEQIKKPPTPQIPAVAKTPGTAVITAQSENVRFAPNGQILGQVHRGDSIRIEKRVVNWLLFYNDEFDSSYVWAPSAGFDYINLYSPYTYYDTTARQFYPVSYFRNLFGREGQKDSILSTESTLFFGDVGLGSHEDIVMEVTQKEIEEVEHGITLHIREPEGYIFQVEIDFFAPEKGIKSALQKCGLPDLDYSAATPRDVVWDKNVIIPGLKIRLERKVWESSSFSGIWFITEEISPVHIE